MSEHSPSMPSYESSGVTVVRQLIEPTMLAFLSQYLNLLGRVGALTPDVQIGRSESLYGDRAFDTVLAQCTPAMEHHAGHRLVPTYSFARVYYRGDELRVHTDRPACQHSASVHLSSSSSSSPPNWPIRAKTLDDVVVSADLAAGDALVYRGCDVPHWRDPCPHDWYAQLFLHWVEIDGPNHDEAFDRRPFLGMPKGSPA